MSSQSHLAAVTFHPQTKTISIWTDVDPDNPVCYVAKTPDDNTGCYLDGIFNLLLFFQATNISTNVEIHIDHLHTYNILTRFLPIWKMHSWYTSQNKPVTNKIILQQIDGLLQTMSQISFRNYSREFIFLDYPLRRAKNCTVPT